MVPLDPSFPHLVTSPAVRATPAQDSLARVQRRPQEARLGRKPDRPARMAGLAGTGQLILGASRLREPRGPSAPMVPLDPSFPPHGTYPMPQADETSDPKKDERAVKNERIKLLASTLNTLGLGLAATGAIVPSITYLSGGDLVKFPLSTALGVTCVALAFALHILAHLVLGGIKV